MDPELPDITSVAPDLALPPAVDAVPGAGRRVRQRLAGYEETGVHHTLYLPVDWKPGVRYPVIVEYPGNGLYSNEYGDVCTGLVEDARLGFGITAGNGFIWMVLPFISDDHRSNQLRWWGDIEATVAYCHAAVAMVIDQYGGDPASVFIAGFSRGAIACNFIGLHDDRIAALWRGFICHSHYDGVRPWPHAGGDQEAARERLARLKGRPQFISQEVTVDDIRDYLRAALPNGNDGNITSVAIPFRNHADLWVLRDLPERALVRAWLGDVTGIESVPPFAARG